jgi:short-subunit dehydrogenase
MKVPKGVLMSAEKVADIGVRAMLRHKAVAIAGMSNKMGALAIKAAPRMVAARVAGMVFKPRNRPKQR